MRYAALASILFLLPLPAHAQVAEARAAFEEGRRHAEAERWADALEAFERSRDLAERPSTIFNIAAALVRLGRATDAIVAVDRYLELSDPRRDARMRGDAQVLREQAQSSLRQVVLRVSPPEAQVEVDGRPVEGAGEERRLTLDPGSHQLAASLEGHETLRVTLEPDRDTFELTLAPIDGTLIVRATVPTASIEVDGAAAGTGQVERSVSPGDHAVRLTAEGYLEFSRRVSVGPGARVLVEAAMQPVPDTEEVWESPLFWGLTGGGVAAVIVTIVLVAVLTAGEEAPYGGSVNVVLAPLVRF